MNIHAQRWFWVVTEPTPDSTIDDIMSKTDLNGFQRLLIGMKPQRPSDVKMVIWTNHEDALLDVMDRFGLGQ
jgi:hypothetical protein